MSIASLIRAMSEAGAPPEAIALAVEAIEAKDAALAAKRAVERDRKRRQRERERDSHGTVTGQSADIPDAPSPLGSPPKVSPDPFKITPPISPQPVVGVGPRKASQFPVPEGCDPSDWRDLLANRKSKRLPMTAAAYRKLLRDLAEQSDEEWPPGRVLRHAAEKGWAAIFNPRETGHPHHGNHRPPRQSGWLDA